MGSIYLRTTGEAWLKRVKAPDHNLFDRELALGEQQVSEKVNCGVTVF